MNTVGVPEGVYNVVHGFGSGSAGEYLTTTKDVDAITFTGETGTGQAILQKAALGVRDVSFELRAKTAAIVFALSDPVKAIKRLHTPSLSTTHQFCPPRPPPPLP